MEQADKKSKKATVVEESIEETPKPIKQSVKVLVVAGSDLVCMDANGNGIRVPAKGHKDIKAGDVIKI